MMPVQWTTSNQLAQVNGVKVLVYAGSGLGKTVLAATAPRPALISAEAGCLSLSRANLERLFGLNNPMITYDIPTIQVSSIEDLNEAYNYFSTNPQARQHFATVCLDSISEIAEVILSRARKTSKDPRQAYGELIDKMEILIRSFRDLQGFNVYMAAKMEPMKDEMSGVIKYGPSMPGQKLGSKVPYFFDEVLRLGVNKDPQGNSYRFLQTQPDIQFEAKDRSGALALIEPPNLTHVFSKILGVN